jgi:NAD(P)-dependent dehydrogenase (short-subunit alcohol dehydrogenase family)
VVINVTSDAGVEAYPGWGGYGASKAALEHLSRTLAAELEGTGIRVYAVDPGDMNTEMHRLAEPGVDLAGLPGPEAAAPRFVSLVEQETAMSGRFVAAAPAVATAPAAWL